MVRTGSGSKRSSSAVPPAEAGGARVVGIARAEALAVSRDGRAVAAAACEIDEAEEHLGRVAAVGVAVEIVLEIGAYLCEARVGLVIEAAYSRQPTAQELEIAKKSIAEDSDLKEGLRLFLQAMMGANDFLYSY